jgi:hypothetical protein
LLLLVGANPLPNAVAASLMTAEHSTISLLHSRLTRPAAQNLQRWLAGRQRSRVYLREIAESRPSSIVQGVQSALGATDAGSVGLHYTGGTKAMSVHAYRAVERWSEARDIRPVCTYLDARTLRMIVDPADPWSGEQEHTEDVGDADAACLDVLDLLTLHGWRLRHPDRINGAPLLPHAAQALARAHGDVAARSAWRAWLDQEVTPKCRREDRPHLWRSNTALAAARLKPPVVSTLEEVRSILRSELRQAGDELEVGAAAREVGCSVVEFCKWLDGAWLESAVLQALRDVRADFGLRDISSNLEPEATGDSPTNFEFDVVALRGYQLFAVSCTTYDRRADAKQKLFEAFMRARQMGGDEARVALVCCSGDPQGLEQEVRRDVDSDERIRVFGREHLSDLATHLGDWIRTASRLE